MCHRHDRMHRGDDMLLMGGMGRLRDPLVAVVFFNAAFTRQEVRPAFLLCGGAFIISFSRMKEGHKFGGALG